MKYLFPENLSQQSKCKILSLKRKKWSVVVREADFKVSCAWLEMGLVISLSGRLQKLYMFSKLHYPTCEKE